jgi:hypothetical protein
MSSPADPERDVMQVCRNGHVLTLVLRSHPQSGCLRCDRCGAEVVSECSTCGRSIPGAILGSGMQPIGALRPPAYCPDCGAAFPWTYLPAPPVTDALSRLTVLLRRLPRMIRQLRVRQGDRPPFRVTDERDLEDLVRAVLPLSFDDIRPRQRTPHYDPGTRTDFLLAQDGIALVIKLVRAKSNTAQLVEQFHEDAACYRDLENCHTLIGWIYDPERKLGEERVVEAACSGREGNLDVHCVVAG